VQKPPVDTEQINATPVSILTGHHAWLLAMVRLRQRSDLYVVVEENQQHRNVDLISISGEQRLPHGVPLSAIREVVEGPPRKN
jgi:hypothetical protein